MKWMSEEGNKLHTVFCIVLLFCWLWFLFTFFINLHYKAIHHTNITTWDTFTILIKKYWEQSDNHKILYFTSQPWKTESHHSCKLPSTVFTNAVLTVLTKNVILVKTRGFTIHVCLKLIHGQMRMNMILKR